MAEEDFKKAQYYIRNGPPNGDSNDIKLLFYAYFKQATVGDVTGTQPWAINFEARAKWDAWDKIKGMSKEEAMQKYVALLDEQAPEWRNSDTMANYS
eukprot:CAMPEP_0174257420 /NCGR_PEP_ID=MMETSP0439-20130205/6554_1 /TAXON_ID=0 /ORGANISM="Stereomyxa ramosa, Strain Chinc5" /LENGTH=96 /DNA_ID=CAMNT_0015340493 /DNA_START=41 /DNA_END=331 /DNA_ORIENTATION=+